jgi:hypothetical protein
MFFLVLFVLLVVSFLMSLLSLKKELKRPKEIEIAKEELMKEKVLFVKD